MGNNEQIPNLEQRTEERRLEELEFGKMYNIGKNKIVTVFMRVGKDSFGTLLDHDEEHFIFDAPEIGGVKYISKRFVVDHNLWGVDFEDLYSHVKEKIGLVLETKDGEKPFIGKLVNYDKKHLFLEERGKKKLKPVLNRNIKDWYTEKDLGTVSYFGY